MSSTEGTTATVKDNRSGHTESDNPDSELMTLLEEFSSLAGDEWPSRTTLPLNSERLNLYKW